MALLLFYLFLALFISFLCSVMESVLLSVPQSFILLNAEKKHRWALRLQEQKTRIDRPLSAILSLNTVAHTIGAAGVGAQAVKLWGEAWFGLVSAVLTILILIITEIIPKTLGARFWRSLAPASSRIISAMIFFTYPLVAMSAYITRIITRRESPVSTSREELAVLVSVGAEEGVLNVKEHRILQNLLRLREIRAADIRTPRVVVASAEESMSLSDFLEAKLYLKFSRIPVYSGSRDNITGYVLRQSVLEKLAEDQHSLTLKDIRRPVSAVPESKDLFSVWEQLIAEKEHIALVVDEYGGLDGIVTMEDIIETLLGLEIVDETDTVHDMQAYARERWLQKQNKYNHLEKEDNS